MPVTHDQIRKMEAEGKARHDADLEAARQNPKVVSPIGGAALLMGDSTNNLIGEFSWSDTNLSLFRKCVRVVNDAGNTISFAVNRAKSGGSVTILAGVISPKLQVDGLDEANAALRKILIAYGSEIPE